MAAVRRDVVKATGGKQVPWENSSLLDDVFLMPRANRPRCRQCWRKSCRPASGQ